MFLLRRRSRGHAKSQPTLPYAGHGWHITHRCHKKEFLKFAKDRQGWIDWLFEAKKRYGLVVLNSMATSNHIHLLIYDGEGGEVIPKSVQLAAGRTAREYNQRKRRKGAYWEDRYHATAVQTDQHLVECIVYMDLHMVRAGVVKHLSEWPHCGYGEIQKSPDRYRLIDRKALMGLLGISDSDQLSRSHRSWVEEALKIKERSRERRWVQIFWNNAPNGLRITDQRGFPREEHLPESHREHGFIIPEGYKPLAGGEAAGRHPRKTEGNGPTPEGVAPPSIKIPRVVFG